MIDESSGNERLMRVRSRGRPRYLIEKRKVSADYAIGLIVVVKAQNGKLVLAGVRDYCAMAGKLTTIFGEPA